MAWYDLPIINNFGSYPDPVGNYPKPDINIVAPANTPFTAPASGTISSIDTSSFFGPSITVKFDTPPNNVAQYYAFNYLSSIASGLQVGQHVNAGDTLGFGGAYQNNSGGTAAFAFSAGPSYGQGTGWSNNVVGTWINPLLDPTQFINSLQSGTMLSSKSNTQGSSSLFPNLSDILGLPSQTDLVSFFQRFMIVSIGGMVVLVGVLVLFFSSKAGQGAIKSAEEVA